MTPTPKPPRIKPPRVQDPRIADYLRASVPEKHQLATQRALRGQIGRATAVRVKCLQCSGYQIEEVKECRVVTCALHPVRPYQGKVTEEESEE